MVAYDGLNRVSEVQESAGGAVANTTSFTYNEIGAPLTRVHDDSFASFTYDARNLLTSVTNGQSAADPDPKVTSYTYTPRGQQATHTKGNGTPSPSTTGRMGRSGNRWKTNPTSPWSHHTSTSTT
jgi:YD repeat-containing protein